MQVFIALFFRMFHHAAYLSNSQLPLLFFHTPPIPANNPILLFTFATAMSKLKKAHLLTGANLGDRINTLTEAKRLLGERAGQIVKVSSWYETEAWGQVDQPSYINQAIEIATSLTPNRLLEVTQQIELELGRAKRTKWASRLIDIDILFYAHRIISLPNLKVPHPHIHRRNFVLAPMLEIAPRKRHPVFKKNIEELYLESKDELDVVLLEL